MTEQISSLADLKPGDIMFGPIGGLVGVGVGLGQLALGEAVRIGRLSVRHVGIVVEAAQPALNRGAELGSDFGYQPPHLVQAMPSGAEEIEMTEATHWTDRHAYFRLTENYPGQAEDAATVARLMVAEKVAYSFASYGALALWHWGIKTPRLEKWIDRRRPSGPYILPSGRGIMSPSGLLPVEAICSVLVDQAWSLAGKRVMHGTKPQVVTPGAMALQLWNREGVVHGGAGLL